MKKDELDKLIDQMPEKLVFNITGSISEGENPTPEENKTRQDALIAQIEEWCRNENK